MTPDAFDERRAALRALHRAASDRLDEQPASRVRTAVLAEAAKATTASRRRWATNPFAQRWPRSLAALLVVSVVTGFVVTHGMRDEPERVVARAPAATTPSTTPPSALPPGDPSSATRHSEAEASADATPPRMAPSAKPSAPAPARTASARRPAAPAPTSPGTRRADGGVPDEAVTPEVPRTGAPAPAPAPKQAKAFAPDPPVATPSPAPPPAASAAARSTGETTERDRTTSPSSASPQRNFALPRTARFTAEPLTPEAWVARIVTLRQAGRDDDADRDLDVLRARYPEFVVPPTALRR